MCKTLIALSLAAGLGLPALAAFYLATSGKVSCDSVNPGYYSFGNKLPVMADVATKNAANGTALLSVSKTF